MQPNDTPPGELCDGCRVAIDAKEDVIAHGGRFFCTETCRRVAMLGEAEQMVMEVGR